MGEADEVKQDPNKSIFVQLQEAEQFYRQFGKVKAEHLPVIYTRKFNISFYGLEKLQNFDSSKYLNIIQELYTKKVLAKHQLIKPACIPSFEHLQIAHSKEYLNSLNSSTKIGDLTEIGMYEHVPNFLLRSKVLTPMLYGVAGTILAAKVALDRGFCINLSGGYHHASGNEGGGFCVYSDITISLRHIRKNYPHIKNIMIIDLDAHQGNGFERDKMESKDANLFIVDVYNRNIYPGDEEAKAAIDISCELKSWVADVEYLKTLRQALDIAFEKFTPQIIYFNAGADVLASDPLGLLNISAEGLIKRDEMVFKEAKQRNIPIVMTLSGAYQKVNAKVVADSIANILKICV